jgi:hypothetical protein
MVLPYQLADASASLVTPLSWKMQSISVKVNASEAGITPELKPNNISAKVNASEAGVMPELVGAGGVGGLPPTCPQGFYFGFPKIKALDQRGEGRGRNTLKMFKAPAQGGEAGDGGNRSPRHLLTMIGSIG